MTYIVKNVRVNLPAAMTGNRYFWRGVIHGLRAPSHVFVHRDYRIPRHGSVGRAWLDVSELLTEAMEAEGASIGQKATKQAASEASVSQKAAANGN